MNVGSGPRPPVTAKRLNGRLCPHPGHSRVFCQCLLWVKAAVDAATCLWVQSLVVLGVVQHPVAIGSFEFLVVLGIVKRRLAVLVHCLAVGTCVH